MKRPAMTREQLAAAGALLAVLSGCVLTAGYALRTRSDAVEELNERREVLSRLARGAASGGAPGQAKVAQAPPTAFIDAPTQGQAGAQLQSYFARLALAQQATTASSGVEAPTQEAPDAIRIQATLEISPNSLQALLYELETGTPYLNVDSIGVQPSSVAARQSPHEAPLRVTLMLRGQWRRGVSSPTPAQAAAEPGSELSNPLAAQPLEGLSATRDQPLFVPTRRPPAPPPPPPAVAERPIQPDAPPEPPALTLFGIVMEAEGARAVVRGPGNESLRLRVGDRVGDWAVTEVERRRLVLSLGDRSETFSLFGKNPGKQPRIAAPAAPRGEQLANSQRRGLSQGSPGASHRNAPAREEPEL
jgi:general secretion pathway protein M